MLLYIMNNKPDENSKINFLHVKNDISELLNNIDVIDIEILNKSISHDKILENYKNMMKNIIDEYHIVCSKIY